MSKKDSKLALTKGKANFNLIGEAKINDYTFQMDNTYDSGWNDNKLNLGVDCGNGNVVYAEMSGGYYPNQDNLIYVKGIKEENGRKVDDFDNQFTIDFEDRFDNDILETVANSSFITVGIEKDNKGKTFYKKFLSAYDAVKYIQEHLEDGTVINVKGTVNYESDGEKVYIKKKINSIALSKAEPENYKATFTQTILLDDGSIGKIDKEKNTIGLSVYAVDYVSNAKINGEKVKIKRNFAFPVDMEFNIGDSAELAVKQINKLFKAKKGEIIEITVDGKFIEGASIVNITLDDIPDDIKELIELGFYTEEEALLKCAVGNTNREKRMIVMKPTITTVGEGDDKKPTISIDKKKYKPDDIELYSTYYATLDVSDNNNDDDNYDTFEGVSDTDSNDGDDDILAMLNDIE